MISITDIIKAHSTIKPYIYKTPLVYSELLSDISGAKVYLKLENMQNSGSFKIRGAVNKILNIPNHSNTHFITASSGNHGYGLAFIAKKLQYDATIVVPTYTPSVKIELIKKQGAELILAGNCWDESFVVAQEIAAKQNKVMISPVGDEDVIMGQGTIALEILDDLLYNFGVNPNYFFCSMGSGSMMAGNGTVIKTLSPQTKVIGFQTYGANAMYQSIQAGSVQELPSITSIIEGFAIKKVDEATFKIVKNVIDDIYLYNDQKCLDAALYMLENTNILIELSASICLVPLLNKDIKFNSDDVIVIVLCGGNNDLEKLKHSFMMK